MAQLALANLANVKRVAETVDRILKCNKASRSLIATASLEFAEVVQALSEAAHSRWVKLLASRSIPALPPECHERHLEQHLPQ